MGMFRADSDAEAGLRIDFPDGHTLQSDVVSGNAPYWERRTLRFTTGPDQTEVLIYAESRSTGTDRAYVDDMGLQWCADQED
jgi:hypothetical protein